MKAVAGLVTLLLLALAIVSCGPKGLVGNQEEQPMPKKPIEQVLQEHTPSLMALPGVVGTGQGLCAGEPCIRVFIVEKSDELLSQIPSDIEGYVVDVQETGEFRKLDPG